MNKYIFYEHEEAKKKKDDLYKLGKLSYKKDDMKWFEKLMKSLQNSKTKSKSNFSSTRKFSAAKHMSGKEQRVMFKMTYGKSMKTHDAYLNEYMPQNNKDDVIEKPELFGTSENEYDDAKVMQHFKMIISPENQNVDLHLLTKQFVEHLEQITGYKLYYRAAIHDNTEHRHCHLCINGKDKNGKKVYFQKEMIRRTMREMLQYITTQMIGERTPEEIEAGKKNFITAKRWTKIDDEIEKLNGIIDENNDSDIKNRMAFLKKIGLADKKDNIYKVKENWKNTLMVTGRYNSFFDEYIKLNGKLEFYSGNEVKGKILKIVSFDKDESWNDAIIVRTDENRCIYVPVWKLKRKDLSGKNVVIPGGKNNLSRQISDKDIHIDSQPTVKNISEKIKNNESQKR